MATVSTSPPRPLGKVELSRLTLAGTSVIIATHDYQLMTQFSAPRLMLESGRLHIHG